MRKFRNSLKWVHGKKTIIIIAWMVCFWEPLPCTPKIDVPVLPWNFEDELPFTTMQAMLQDQYGDIWFGTNEKLIKYDGHRITIYPNRIGDSDFFDQISSLCEDTVFNKLWIGSNKGLFSYDYQTSQIHNHPLSRDKLTETEVSDIVTGPDSNIWIASSRGLIKFNPREKSQGFTNIGPENIRLLCLEFVGKSIWTGTYKGIYIYDLLSKEFSIRNKYGVGKTINDIRYDNGQIYYLKEDSLFIEKITGAANQSLKRFLLPFEEGTSLHITDDNKCWISSLGKVAVYQKDTLHLVNFQSRKRNQKNIPHKVTIIFQDRSGMLWFGTLKEGIFKEDIYSKNFYTQRLTLNKDEQSESVFGIEQTHNNKLLVSTINKGVLLIDGDSLHQIYSTNSPPSHRIETNKIATITLSSTNQLWMGGLDWGLYNTPPGKTFPVRYFDPENTQGLSGWSIRSIYEDKQKNIWICTADGGLCKYAPNSQTFKTYIDELAPHNTVWRTLDPGWNEPHLLVGTEKLSLILFNIEKEETHELKTESGQTVTNIRHFFQVSDSCFWAATRGNGLYKITLLPDTIIHIDNFNTSHGLSSNNINVVLPGNDGSLWLSTERGISAFDTTNQVFQNYDLRDGILDMEMNFNAFFQDTISGRIYFGGQKGLTSFIPSQIKKTNIEAIPRITQIHSNDQHSISEPDAGNREILFSQKAEVPSLNFRYNNTLTLKFSSTCYIYPEKCRFKYKIEGLNNSWTLVSGLVAEATLMNLKPGKYTFLLKASNPDGDWSPHTARLNILVLPAWWQTWWARALFAITLILMGTVIVRMRVRKLKKKQLDLKQQILDATRSINQQKEKIDQQYNNLKHLSEMGQSITSSIDPREMIQKIYATINKIMDASHFSIGKLTPHQQEIFLWEKKGNKEQVELIKTKTEELEPPERWCLNNLKPLFIKNVENEFNYYRSRKNQPSQNTVFSSAIILPLQTHRNEASGFLSVKSPKTEAFDKSDLKILTNLAKYISIAFDNAYAFAKLKEQDESKTRFFTNISHEFKTPLTLILNHTEDLIEKKLTQKESRNQLLSILNNSDRLLTLINQLLKIGEIEEGISSIKDQPVNINQLLNKVRSLFEAQAKRSKMNFVLQKEEKNAQIVTDKDKLETIIINLLSNAFKFSGPKDTITLGASISDNNCHIWVEDTGIGIPEDKLSAIFDRYYGFADLDDENKDRTQMETYRGSGIGLAFVKMIVDSMQGEIDIKSQINKGTRIEIKLPNTDQKNIKNTDPDNFQTKIIDQEEHTNINIPKNFKIRLTIIEDNPELNDYLTQKLGEFYSITSFYNGNEAWQQINSDFPDLIISDIMMPGMNGIELCHKVKENKTTKHIPVILLTAKDSTEQQIEGLNTGADDYITKPFSMNLLHSRVDNILRNRNILREYFKNSLPNYSHILTDSIEENEETFLKKTDEIINQNISNSSFSINDLAREIGIGRTTFYKKFKLVTGLTLNTYILNKKMKLAEHLLKNTNKTVAEISILIGYREQSSFSKAFKKHFGVYPSGISKHQNT